MCIEAAALNSVGFADGLFRAEGFSRAEGQKRGLCVGKTKRGKGTKILAVADGNGLPSPLALAALPRIAFSSGGSFCTGR